MMIACHHLSHSWILRLRLLDNLQEAQPSARHYRPTVATGSSRHILHRSLRQLKAVARWADGSAACYLLPRAAPIRARRTTTTRPRYAHLQQWRPLHHVCYSASLHATVRIADQLSLILVMVQKQGMRLLQRIHRPADQLLRRSAGLTECLTEPCNSLQTQTVTQIGVRIISGCSEFGIKVGGLSKSILSFNRLVTLRVQDLV